MPSERLVNFQRCAFFDSTDILYSCSSLYEPSIGIAYCKQTCSLHLLQAARRSPRQGRRSLPAQQQQQQQLQSQYAWTLRWANDCTVCGWGSCSGLAQPGSPCQLDGSSSCRPGPSNSCGCTFFSSLQVIQQTAAGGCTAPSRLSAGCGCKAYTLQHDNSRSIW